MTIIGIGIDIIENIRIKNIFLNFNHKFAQRILSQNEWNEYVNRKKYVCFLAKRFAVKEAASKALGTGIRNGVSFNQIELYNNIYGKPKLRFSKHAYKTFKKLKCNQSHVTVTDQRKYTCAIVILEKI